MIDIHNHVIYGLDDGAKDLEESLRMLEEYWRQGVTKVIATPHYRRDMFQYDLDLVQKNMDILRTEMEEKGIRVEIHKGNEAYLNAYLLEDLQSGKCLTMAGSQYVLVEILGMDYFDRVLQLLFELACNGYKPIIAHCERMVKTKADLKKVQALKQKGYHLQINAGVLLGKTPFYLKRWVYKSLRNGTIDFVASDAHNLAHRKINLDKAQKVLIRKIGRTMTEKVLGGNQAKIILNAEID